MPDTNSTSDVVSALDFLQSSKQVSSEVVQALRQAVDVFSQQARSHPASGSVVEKLEDAQIDGGLTKRKFKPASSKRQQLTAEEAAEIYSSRPQGSSDGDRPKRGSMILCKELGPKYGVSAKTIRDIWRGRTWVEATRHLWTQEEKDRRAAGGDADSESGSESVGEDHSSKRKKSTKRWPANQAPIPSNFRSDDQHHAAYIPNPPQWTAHSGAPVHCPATAPPHAQPFMGNLQFTSMNLNPSHPMSNMGVFDQMLCFNNNFVQSMQPTYPPQSWGSQGPSKHGCHHDSDTAFSPVYRPAPPAQMPQQACSDQFSAPNRAAPLHGRHPHAPPPYNFDMAGAPHAPQHHLRYPGPMFAARPMVTPSGPAGMPNGGRMGAAAAAAGQPGPITNMGQPGVSHPTPPAGLSHAGCHPHQASSGPAMGYSGGQPAGAPLAPAMSGPPGGGGAAVGGPPQQLPGPPQQQQPPPHPYPCPQSRPPFVPY